MLFVRTDKLKVGMRLARPIYNKNGVLLYERDSKVTKQGIVSIGQFKLIGIFILEAAEPAPPMTEEDIAFERFQTMSVFSIQEELDHIIKIEKKAKIDMIASDIIKNYGMKIKKVNFIQNLRSKEDYVYKHALNVAILCALMTRVLKVKPDRQLDTVIASIVCDIAEVEIGKNNLLAGCNEQEAKEKRELIQNATFGFLEGIFYNKSSIKVICVECFKRMRQFEKGEINISAMSIESKILMIARLYDNMTAMNIEETPKSEVKAIKFLTENDKYFDPTVVNALIESISILVPGTCVELNNGEKGLVLISNEKNVLEPVILSFKSNEMLDLGSKKYKNRIVVKDVMKTLDNRNILDDKTLSEYGYTNQNN